MDSVYMFRQLRGPSKTVVCREQSRRAAMEASSSASVETAKVVVESVKVGVVNRSWRLGLFSLLRTTNVRANVQSQFSL
jgi:hypothetical protein